MLFRVLAASIHRGLVLDGLLPCIFRLLSVIVTLLIELGKMTLLLYPALYLLRRWIHRGLSDALRKSSLRLRVLRRVVLERSLVAHR